MSKPIANVNPSYDTWAVLLERVNEMADTFTIQAVTTFANTTGAQTNANGTVNGIFGSSNILFAGTALRGGSVTTSADLNVSSNAIFNGSLSRFNANVFVTSVNTMISSNVSTFNGNTVNISATTNANNTFNISGTLNQSNNANFTGTNLTVTSNANFNNTLTTIQGGTANVVSTAFFRSAVNVVGPQMTVTANTLFSTANVTINGGTIAITSTAVANFSPTANVTNVSLGTDLQRWQLFANTTNISTALLVNGTTNLNGVTAVAANATFTGANTAVNGTALNVAAATTMTGTWTLNNTGTVNGVLTTNANTNINGTQSTLNANVVATNSVTITGAGVGSALAVAAPSTFSNTVLASGPTFTATANTNLNSANVTIQGGTVFINSTVGASINPTSNTGGLSLGSNLQRWNVNANTVNISTALNVPGSTTLSGLTAVTANANFTGANTTIGGSVLNVTANSVMGTVSTGALTTNGILTTTANSAFGGATTNVYSNTFFTAGLSISGPTLFAANTTTTTLNGPTTANTLSVTGQASLTTLNVSGFSYFTNAALPIANNVNLGATNARWAVFASTVDVTTVQSTTVVANTVSISGAQDILSATSTLGADTTAPLVVFSFPRATYRSGTLNIQLKSTDSYQHSETAFVHDVNDVYISTYGMIYSNTQLGDISAVINGANIDIRVKQNTASLNARVVAELIK